MSTGAVLGIFATWQPRYAECGIATFPVAADGGGKKPAVCGYMRVGPEASRQFVLKFPANDSFGFVCGRRNGITVLDVDSKDEGVLSDAISRHGQTPFVVRSGSGNFQAWYRHAGERRLVRPWGKEIPIDILGGGYVVAPPSKGARGQYQIIQGNLDDIGALPVMRGLDFPKNGAGAETETPRNGVVEGERNDALWRACMTHALHCPSLNALLEFARSRNEENMPPLSDAEVARVAKSAWHKTESGNNWFGGQMVAVSNAVVDQTASTDPLALALLIQLRRWHGWRQDFYLANATADKLGWSLPAFKLARRRLVDIGELKCVSPGGRGQHDPPLYTWP